MMWRDVCPGCKGYDEPTEREARLIEERDAARAELAEAREMWESDVAGLRILLDEARDEVDVLNGHLDRVCDELGTARARLHAVINLCDAYPYPQGAVTGPFARKVRAAATGDTQ